MITSSRAAPPLLPSAASSSARALENEERAASALLNLADLVFAGGPSLYQAKRERHANAHCFPSSVDVEHFGKARDESTKKWDADDSTGLRFEKGVKNVEYFRDVRPIFQEHCQGCHQPAKRGGEYVMTAFDQLLKGGESAEAACPHGSTPQDSRKTDE